MLGNRRGRRAQLAQPLIDDLGYLHTFIQSLTLFILPSLFIIVMTIYAHYTLIIDDEGEILEDKEGREDRIIRRIVRHFLWDLGSGGGESSEE